MIRFCRGVSVLLLPGVLALSACAPAAHRAAAPHDVDVVRVATPTGERDADRASILAALEQVQPGGTVQFAPGTYLIGGFNLDVSIPRLTLLGHPEGTTIRGCEPDVFADYEVARFACNALGLSGEHQTVRGMTFEYAWHGLVIGCCLPTDMDAFEAWEGPERGRPAGHLIEGNTFRYTPNGIRVIGESSEPIVIRNNRFLNVYHAIGINGRTVHFLDNEISVDEPLRVPTSTHPGDAINITPLAQSDDQTSCADNVIARNRIEGHTHAIRIGNFGPGTSCRRNVIRDNAIVSERVRFGVSWFGIRVSNEADSTIAGVPISLVNFPVAEPEKWGRAGEAGQETVIEDNLIEGNQIIGADGLGIEVLHASRNRIVNNTIAGVRLRNPFPGNGLLEPVTWLAANGAGIWLSPGSNGNEIIGNTFEDVASAAIVIEGDRNRVETRGASDTVRDLGSGNRVVATNARETFLLDGDELLRRVHALADSVLESGPTAGLTVGVARGGEILLSRGFGYANLEHRVPTTERTVYRIGSLSKLFAAVAVLRLADQGRLSLDDEITRFLPEFPAEGSRTTVRHLLNHTSGIASITSPPLWDLIRRDRPDIEPEALILAIGEQPPHFSAGDGFSYNSSGYFLLGLIVERASGRSYEEYLAEAVIRPAGLEGASLCRPGRETVEWARGYEREHEALIEGGVEVDLVLAQAAGSLCSTATDLIQLNRALVGGGLVSTELLDEMTAPTRLTDGTQVGYGYALTLGSVAGRRAFHHDGYWGGFSAYFAYLPDDDLTIVVLANTWPEAPEQIGERIVRAAFGLPGRDASEPAREAGDRERYLGEYGMVGGPTLVRVFEQEGTLMAEFPGEPAFRLHHLSGGEFRSASVPRIRLSFDSEEGRAVHVVYSYAASPVFMARRQR